MKSMNDSDLKHLYGDEKMTLHVVRDDGSIDENAPMAFAVDHWYDDRMVVDKEKYNEMVRYIKEDAPNDEHSVLKAVHDIDFFNVEAVAESQNYIGLELTFDR